MAAAARGRPIKEGKRMGRPFMIRLPEDLAEAIEKIAESMPDKQERAVVIRMLLRDGLAARGRVRK